LSQEETWWILGDAVDLSHLEPGNNEKSQEKKNRGVRNVKVWG